MFIAPMPIALMAITITVVTRVVIFMIIMTLIMAFVTSVISLVVMLLLVAWRIFMVVPIVLHKVDTLTTCVVPMAIFTPVLRMPWWNAHIDRFAFYVNAFNYSRLAINHLWLWVATYIQSTVEPWLANTH